MNKTYCIFSSCGWLCEQRGHGFWSKILVIFLSKIALIMILIKYLSKNQSDLEQ